MKILYTNHIITPYLHSLLEKLSAYGCETIMLLSESNNNTMGKGVKQNDTIQRSYRVRYSRSKKMWYGKAALTDLKTVLLQEKPGILIIVFPYFMQLFFDRTILKLLRKNNIHLIIREIPFQTPPFGKLNYFKNNPAYNENMELLSRGLSFKLRSLLLMYIRRFVYSKADAALSYTSRALQILPSYGIEAEKIFVTYNTSDTDSLFASREKIIQSPQLFRKRKRILHIGRLVKWKRVDLLIDAFQKIAEKFPDSELVIIGNGPEKENLMQHVANAGLTERVIFAGAIYDADTLGKYMYESSVYVLAGMGGLSINDAMCYSLPVICSVCDGTEQDLITDGVNGYFFKEGDADSLAEKIALILSNDALRKQMGETAYRVIKEKINSDTVARRYIDAFENISSKNMNNNLTDRNYWKAYWSNYQYRKVPQKIFYDKYIPTQAAGKSFIEIGGFPGTMSVYFYKKYRCKVSLLDFYIDNEMIEKMETTNDIPQGTIQCIKSDFFNFTPEKLYDIVFSFGFIEHFDDTQGVIKRHVDLLANNGYLLIVLPNFLGLNGWIQRRFDRENFDAHNTGSMEILRLKEVLNLLNLNNIRVEYTRKPIIWLEPKSIVSPLLRKLVKLFSYALKLFPIPCKLLSPYIVISATKQ